MDKFTFQDWERFKERIKTKYPNSKEWGAVYLHFNQLAIEVPSGITFIKCTRHDLKCPYCEFKWNKWTNLKVHIEINHIEICYHKPIKPNLRKMFEEIDNNWRCRQSAFNVPDVSEVSQQNNDENFDEVRLMDIDIPYDSDQLYEPVENNYSGYNCQNEEFTEEIEVDNNAHLCDISDDEVENNAHLCDVSNERNDFFNSIKDEKLIQKFMRLDGLMHKNSNEQKNNVKRLLITLGTNIFDIQYHKKLNHNYYIEPHQVDVVSLDGKQIIGKYHCVSIYKLAHLQLSNHSIRKRLDEENEGIFHNPQHVEGKYSSIRDAEIFQRTRGKLKIELYLDECQVKKSNPRFGSKSSDSNMTFFYMTFTDLRYNNRCKMIDIIPFMMIDKTSIKTIKQHHGNLKIIFENLVEELIILATEGLNFHGKTYYSTLSAVLGDSKAIYEFAGFRESFKVNALWCRFCGLPGMCNCRNIKETYININKTQYCHFYNCDFNREPLKCDEHPSIQHTHNVARLLMSEDFNSLDEISQSSKDLGMYRSPALINDELRNLLQIDITNIFPPDAMHDVSERILSDVILLLLDGIYTKWKPEPTLQYQMHKTKIQHMIMIEILHKFQNFNYYEGNIKIGKEKHPIKNQNHFYIEANATQIMEVFLKLEIILFKMKMPVFNIHGAIKVKKFSLKNILKTISFNNSGNQCHVPIENGWELSLTDDDLQKMSKIAPDLVFKIVTLTNTPVRCLLHHIVHYSNLVRRFGPLYLYTNFRYERKHQEPKNVSRNKNNHINFGKSVFEEFALTRAKYLKSIDFKNMDYFQNQSSMVLKPFHEEIEKYVSSKLVPFSLNKNLLIKENSESDIWFRPERCVKRPSDGKIICVGSTFTLEKKPNKYELRAEIQKLKLNETNLCLEVDWLSKWADQLHHDFIYEHGWTDKELAEIIISNRIKTIKNIPPWILQKYMNTNIFLGWELLF
ncbi:hypothetical protein BLOT_004848 [Blomia tropicalis]|nr:hypothetical protein BLOT_004848 [Blomia tropicalis]